MALDPTQQPEAQPLAPAADGEHLEGVATGVEGAVRDDHRVALPAAAAKEEAPPCGDDAPVDRDREATPAPAVAAPDVAGHKGGDEPRARIHAPDLGGLQHARVVAAGTGDAQAPEGSPDQAPRRPDREQARDRADSEQTVRAADPPSPAGLEGADADLDRVHLGQATAHVDGMPAAEDLRAEWVARGPPRQPQAEQVGDRGRHIRVTGIYPADPPPPLARPLDEERDRRDALDVRAGDYALVGLPDPERDAVIRDDDQEGTVVEPVLLQMVQQPAERPVQRGYLEHVALVGERLQAGVEDAARAVDPPERRPEAVHVLLARREVDPGQVRHEDVLEPEARPLAGL